MMATSPDLKDLRSRIFSEEELAWRLREAVARSLERQGCLVTALWEVDAGLPPGFFPWRFVFEARIKDVED
jgi:hypothetical protein